MIALVVVLLLAVGAVIAVLVHGGGSSASKAKPSPSISGGGPSAAAVGSEPVPAGFPDAADTGVPAGTRLHAYTGPMTIRTKGTVISDALITGCLVVAADDVTIKDSRIVCDLKRAVLSLNGGSAVGTVLTDVELDGVGVATVGVDAKNCVADGLNVYATGDGVHLGRDSTLENSYIHDLADQPNLHHDDLQTLHGSTATNIVVRHNTLLAFSKVRNDNTVYHLGSGAISNVLVTDNYMDGGHYTIQVDNGPGQSNIVFTANHFGRHYHFAILDAGKGTAVTFAGNVWQDTGRPATAANSRGKGQAAGSGASTG